jgi:hypothetical protein
MTSRSPAAQAQFNAAAEKAKTLGSPSNDDLLSLYKYFKQVRRERPLRAIRAQLDANFAVNIIGTAILFRSTVWVYFVRACGYGLECRALGCGAVRPREWRGAS